MENHKIQKLINIAQEYMSSSPDPIHDLGHAKRVVEHAELLSRELGLNETQKNTVILAAWWHDVSRTIIKKPSFVWMFIFDDLISAFMLWRETIRCRLFGEIVELTTRVIFCKSMSTSGLLTKLLLTKTDRILVDIIHDADNLDVVHLERIKKVQILVDTSIIYMLGYKITIAWYLKSKQLHMKTKAARKYIIKFIQEFIDWVKQKWIMLWHIERFGEKWVEKNLQRAELLLQYIKQLNLQAG